MPASVQGAAEGRGESDPVLCPRNQSPVDSGRCCVLSVGPHEVSPA